MAYNSLSEFFAAIADAIRSKTGGTDPIKASTFPEAIENIQSGGSAWEDALVYGNANMTQYSNDRVTGVRPYGFAWCVNVTDVVLPNALTVGNGAFQYCEALETVDLPVTVSIGPQVFVGCRNLKALILRNTSRFCALSTDDVFFGSSGVILGTGYVYVPAALVDAYKADTNWATYAAQIRAIEDYPEVTG